MSVIDTGTASTLPTQRAVVREQPGGETMRATFLKRFGGEMAVVADRSGRGPAWS